MNVISLKHLVFLFIGLLCITPLISSPVALILGFLMALAGFVPAHVNLGVLTKKLLAICIVGLGFGIQLGSAIEASLDNLGLILVSIVATLIAALVLTRAMSVDTKTGYLIGSGTAICGGSAIAGVAPAIEARNEQIAIAIACVFVLNSIALIAFPVLGRLLGLDEYTFGVWAAIAIHDTSSVVGAAEAFGDDALITATTVKLARALGIIPLVILSAVVYSRLSHQPAQGASPGALPGSSPGSSPRESGKPKVTVPQFIVFYVVAILIAHFIPQGEAVYDVVFTIARNLLVLCLYLIGASMTIAKMKAAGFRPMLIAVILWIGIGAGSLAWLML